MPIPSVEGIITEIDEIGDDVGGVNTNIAALPATPLEADLPDIVQIVADLNAATGRLQTVVSQILVVLKTTRIGQ